MRKAKLSDILNGKIDNKLLAKIDIVFNNNKLFKDFLNNITSDELLKVFYLANKSIKNNNINVNKDIVNKLELLSDKYVKVIHSVYIPSNILDHLDDNHSYSKEYGIIADDIPLFSLNELFSYENSKKCPYDINGVTLITPTRTISVFCDNFYDDRYGTGHHDKRFSQISKAIYCKNFENAQSGSDIQIRYVNTPEYNKHHTILILVEVPYPINSSQLKSLEFLNEEIKKYKNDKKVTFEVEVGIRDYFNNINNNYDIERSSNLDLLFKNITVNNDLKNSVEQRYRLGYPNYENHYNDGNYKLINDKSKSI